MKKKAKINKEKIKEKILEIIKKKKEGINRKELWRVAKIKSENGTKALIELIKEGEIVQIERYIDGKKIQLLKFQIRALKILPLDGVKDLPCLPCGDFNTCSEIGNLTPISCKKLEDWLEQP